MTKVRILVFLVGAIALILVFLALQLLIPGDTIQQTGPDNATIVFSADQGTVAAPGGCVMVRWQVDHIQAVYINKTPTVGAGQQNVCVDEQSMPVLHVQFSDNSATDYALEIHFLVDEPSTWLLISAAILLAVLSLIVSISRPGAAPVQKEGKGTPRIALVFAGIGVLAIGIAALGLVSEFALRFYFSHYGTQDEQFAYLASWAEIDARQTDTIPLPFVESGLSPDYPGHNALGYRGADFQVPKPDGTYRIVVLGDSSTYGVFVPYEQSYPYELQQILRDDGYKNVEVINGGVPGYTSWNIFATLALRATEIQPDLVIVYEGFPDVEAREVSPDCYSTPSPFLGLDPRRQVRAEPEALSSSALYRVLAINLGWMKNPAQDDAGSVNSRIGCKPEVPSEIPQNLKANPPVYFERNIRNMIAVAQASGIKILFMTWAYDPNNSHVVDYQRAAIAENNAVTKKVAQENGALFFDYAAIASTDSTVWSDFMHPNAQGNQAQAQAIANFLVDQKVVAK